MNFKDLLLHPSLLEGLDAMGFKQPTPIQGAAIPEILQHRDMIASAQTGTGKTAAYILPVIHHILSLTDHRDKIKALVLVPTRELAMQIDQNIQGLAYFAPVSSIAVFGGGDGHSFEVQKKALHQGSEIVIATPGRLIAMLTSFKADFSQLRYLILDEADRMLDMGFNEDIMKIISHIPVKRQTLMFSATMPPKIRKLASALLQNPLEINLAVSTPAIGVTQRFFAVNETDKLLLLQKLLSEESFDSIIIFASTKQKVKNLESIVKKIKLHALAFHSDLSQEERDRAMLAFRNKQLPVLIGTDIISRGIDVEGVGLVVNFDVPPDPEDYIHRIGRTARADAKGTAITFVHPDDARKFYRIEGLLGRSLSLETIPAEIGISPEINKQTRTGNKNGKKRFNPKNAHSKNPSRNQGSGNNS